MSAPATVTPETAPGARPLTQLRTADCCGPSRRTVLRGLGLGGAATMIGSTAVTMSGAPAMAAEAGDDSVLVVLSLRGAADGLSMVVPHGDPVYYQARPRIGVPAERLLARDSFFGLHPTLAPLLTMWQSGEMAAVHATGLPVPNRSHFAAMEELEDAAPGSVERSGWLNRLLGETPGDSAVEGVSIDSICPPASMFGTNPNLAFGNLATASIAGDYASDSRRTRRTTLTRMWGSDPTPMGAAMRGAMQAVDDLAPAVAQPLNTSRYPSSDLGKALATVAQTIRGDVGTRVVTVDSGSWDMHNNVGTLASGRMINCLDDLAKALAAFFGDLGTMRGKVTVVTISEFGRRVAENSSFGLDHGWGNAMLVLGAGVVGGRYYGRWPGLTNTLDADLTVTTDYRHVLAEIVASRFPAASSAQVFPGFAAQRLGVMAGA